MAADHPLAASPTSASATASTCPISSPHQEYGVRHLLELATRGRARRLAPVLEADSFEMMRRYVLYERVISFDIPIGLRRRPRASSSARFPSATSARHPPAGQLRGRTLPVASAKFALQLAAAFEALA